ncbi:helix-turn-helix domain-containing protein [Bacillus sp. H-16]|uniref:ArsR/SmtB family transcription factor n=1 Tax=Alteribacter salitolerans TaxID=2912333 RepID=UPI0019629F5C|nr:helix-turn-helix domain-containing protein [Alteribacter salitolerans]MBM7095345.1 helix-turn-helix domain-containing protein [Alteribacter salitolerans]
MSGKNKSMNISIGQAKLLGSALRVKIISQLIDEPKTSKQVANLIGESPGNVHYHIKKLHDGGLLELVEEKKLGGVVEKYYRSVASRFHSPEGATDPALEEGFKSKDSSFTSVRLQLSPEQRKDFHEEVMDLLEKWVKRTAAEPGGESEEFSVGVKVVSTEAKGDGE